MEILIGSPYSPPNNHTPDSFLIEVRTMIGDADGYDECQFGYFPNTEEGLVALKRCITWLESMGDRYPDNNPMAMEQEIEYLSMDISGRSDLRLEKLKALLKETDYWIDWNCEEGNDFRGDWPYVPDGQGYTQSFDGYNIYYFDKNKIKHYVEVQL